MKRQLGPLLTYQYLWGILICIALGVVLLPWLFESYESIGFLNKPLHSVGGTIYQVPDEPENIAVVEMSVIQEALFDQGFDTTVVSGIATRLYQDILTPVATATANPKILLFPTSISLSPTQSLQAPTATLTIVRTRTSLATPTLTRTPTSTRTFTAFSTATRTQNPQPSATSSPTPTATLTSTPTFTATPSATATPTATASGVVPSITASLSPTLTNTLTPTRTITIAPTILQTATQSLAETMTPTGTPSPTQTATSPAIFTQTPTGTVTQTLAPTASHTSTQISTGTVTQTPAVTASPTSSPAPIGTITSTSTPVSSPTAIWTLTGTITPTQAPSATFTSTPSLISTPTETPTLSLPTGTFTPTFTSTSDPTATSTPGILPTPTEIFTPTITMTPVVTLTPTITETATPASTNTPTATPTQGQCLLPEEITGVLPSDDSYIYHVKPDDNFGHETTIEIRPQFNAEMRGLVRFDLSSIPPNALITSAHLYLNTVGANNGQVNSIYRLTSGWSEGTVTWNYPWSVPGGDFDGDSIYSNFAIGSWNCVIDVDVTGLVSNWADGTFENYGILITANGPRSIVHYVSKDDPRNADLAPRLGISYTIPE